MKNRSKDGSNKKINCELCGKFFTRKWLTTHIEREHQNESKSNVLEKPKMDYLNTNDNNRTLLIAPSFSCKTYLMLKFLSRIRNQDLYIFINSPPEQYSISEMKIKEVSDEKEPLNENGNAIIVSHDILGSSISRY